MEPIHAWCAGFFDAEGCVRISRHEVVVSDARGVRPVHQVCLLISQNRREPLERFKAAMNCGGSLDQGRKYPQYKHTLYTLKYSSARAMSVLAFIRPHLRRKRLEVEIIDRFVGECEIGQRGGRSVSREIYALRDFYYHLISSQKRNHRHD